jgi:hypothetical protein
VRFLYLGEIKHEAAPLAFGSVTEVLADRTRHELPAPCIFVEPRDQRASAGMACVGPQHVRRDRQCKLGVDAGHGGGGSRLKRERLGFAS